MTDKYVPQDHMALWWLGNPAQPRPVGELGLAAGAVHRRRQIAAPKGNDNGRLGRR